MIGISIAASKEWKIILERYDKTKKDLIIYPYGEYFIEKLNNFKYKDFKILEIIPEKTLNETFLFYSNDLEGILDKFKNKYINLMINESKYTTNICIQGIRINTSNYILDELKDIIHFTY